MKRGNKWGEHATTHSGLQGTCLCLPSCYLLFKQLPTPSWSWLKWILGNVFGGYTSEMPLWTPQSFSDMVLNVKQPLECCLCCVLVTTHLHMKFHDVAFSFRTCLRCDEVPHKHVNLGALSLNHSTNPWLFFRECYFHVINCWYWGTPIVGISIILLHNVVHINKHENGKQSGRMQGSTKPVSDSPGLVDFPVEQAISLVTCLTGKPGPVFSWLSLMIANWTLG